MKKNFEFKLDKSFPYLPVPIEAGQGHIPSRSDRLPWGQPAAPSRCQRRYVERGFIIFS